MGYTRIYLIRHGQVKGYEQKRYNGQVNVPLTDLGREQSHHLDRALRKVQLAAVYSSDLDRSRFCAELIADTHNLSVVQDAGLRELHIGAWEGRTWAELEESYPDDWQARLDDLVHFRVPGGESLQDAADRVLPALKKIIADHDGGNIALVAHGGVNRIILLDAIGAPLSQAFSIEQDFGCLNIIDYQTGGHSIVKRLNCPVQQFDAQTD